MNADQNDLGYPKVFSVSNCAQNKILMQDTKLRLLAKIEDDDFKDVDNCCDSFWELSIIDIEQFEVSLERGQANFELANAELDADITGIAKGILHGLRIYARGKYANAA